MNPADNEEFLQTMRAEWARCKARADRWDEEQALLLEEMRRIIEYFQWKSRWWRNQAGRRADVPARLKCGLRIYARKQAAVFYKLAIRTASFWVHELASIGPLPPWIRPYEKYARKVRPRGRNGMAVLDGEELDVAFGVEASDSSDSEAGSDRDE